MKPLSLVFFTLCALIVAGIAFAVSGLYNVSARELDRKEIFWVIDNGLKMTGMPAFGGNHEREEIIGMTAFIEKLPQFDEQGYAQFVQQAKAHGGEHHHDEALAPDKHPEGLQGHSHEDNGHHH